MSGRTPELHLTETVPPRYERTYRRALGLAPFPSPSRTAAIKCMCVECQGYEDGVVEAVRHCASVACPLWAVRPYQRGGEDEDGDSGDLTSDESTDPDPSPANIDELIRRDEIRQRRVEALIKARAARSAKSANGQTETE